MNTDRLIVLTLGTVLLAGCPRNEPAQPASPTPQPSAASPVAPPPPPPTTTQASPPAVATGNVPATNAATPPVQPVPNSTQTKAAVGVGVKGRGYGQGVVATPVASLFAVRERLVFEVQIPEALKLFKAMEDRLPKSHEEFMQRIIKENNIVLPLLPEGSRYLYDPKRGELMVESPSP